MDIKPFRQNAKLFQKCLLTCYNRAREILPFLNAMQFWTRHIFKDLDNLVWTKHIFKDSEWNVCGSNKQNYSLMLWYIVIHKHDAYLKHPYLVVPLAVVQQLVFIISFYFAAPFFWKEDPSSLSIEQSLISLRSSFCPGFHLNVFL